MSLPKKKMVRRQKWSPEKLEIKPTELSSKAFNKKLEILADLFYHAFAGDLKNQNNSKPKKAQLDDAAA